MRHYRQAVLRAAELIERHLRAPIPLEAIARRAGFSLWHFHRIFSDLTGETLGGYIRRRRLTAAADDLVRTRRTILDLALEYQFESHEAFTRAFRATFQVTPSEFRRTRALSWSHTRPALTLQRLKRLPRQTSMEPSLVALPTLHLLGLSARFIPPLSPDADNLDVIPRLYARFCPLLPTLPTPLERCLYGATRCPGDADRRHPDEREYLAAIRVPAGTPASAPFVQWEIPASTYACFTHRGPVARLGETINYAFGSWLPRSGYVHTGAPNLDRQDERFGDGGAESVFDFLLPVRAR
jgi:AraC family transcriptional regulator